MTSTLKLIAQGAEAKIFLTKSDALTHPNNKKNKSHEVIIKARTPKSYRIPEIDNAIRKRRTKAEEKLLRKASKIIDIPAVITVIGDKSNFGGNPPEYSIKMEYINGKKLSQHLDEFPLKEQKRIMNIIGENTAKLHKNDIIHGDLTTSNMILVEDDNIKSNFEKQLEELKKLNLPKGEYAIFGGGPLGIRGIRKCQDIDIVVDETLWKKYKSKQNWEYKITENGIEHLSKGIIEFWHNWLPWYSRVDNFIKNAETIEGFPFVKLKYVIEWKKKHGREKDKRDITLIKNYLSQKESINIPKVFFIDFGLGYISKKIEDKAVDLHLIKQALEAKHFTNWKILFEEFSKSYEKTIGKEESKKIFDRLIAVEKRGRYRH